jgi:predicted RNA-binding Zn ribbon-like protein
MAGTSGYPKDFTVRTLLGDAQLAAKTASQNGLHDARLSEFLDATARGDEQAAARLINALLEENPAKVAVRSGPHGLAPDVFDAPQSCAAAGTTAAVLGLAVAFCELGPGRLGRCEDPGCATAFVDQTTNHSRRYCSERCATRINVSAYRTRLRQRSEHETR